MRADPYFLPWRRPWLKTVKGLQVGYTEILERIRWDCVRLHGVHPILYLESIERLRTDRIALHRIEIILNGEPAPRLEPDLPLLKKDLDLKRTNKGVTLVIMS